MAVNRRRGEVAIVLDGRERRLCLTLSALAELEDRFGTDMGGLVARLSRGQLAAADMVAVIGAGLRGAGEDASDEAVAAMRAEGGAVGFARATVELLRATFGGEDD